MFNSVWNTVPFADILTDGTRNGIYKPKEFHGSGAKIVNMGELFTYPRLFSVPMKRLEITNMEKKKFGIQSGDLIFARRSLVAEGAGKCSVVMETDGNTVFESSIIRGRPNSQIAHSLFLFYFFSSVYGRNEIATIQRDMAVSGITGKDLLRLEIPLPPLAEQKAIANILGSLDDKIELNRKMNESLEGIARALFKSWFVDFDSVRIKADGGQPPGLDSATAALFPSTFQDSALGKIPEGWRVEAIGDVVKVAGGGTPSTKNPEYWEGGTFHWSTPKDLAALSSPVLINTERKVTQKGLDKISSGLLPAGTVLLSSRAPIGYLAISEVPIAINQGYIAMVCEEKVSKYYILFWCQENMGIIESNANGTTFLEISKKNFRPIKILIPPVPIFDAFNTQVKSLYRCIVNNERESRTLTTLRDTLLPKLISGQVRIPEADKIVGEVL